MSYGFSHRFQIDAAGKRIPPSPTSGMEAAVRYYRAGDYAEVERCCLELIAHDARHFDALHLLGVVCLDQSRFADSAGYLTRADSERPDDPRIQYNLGSALLGLKQYEQAEPHLRRAVALRPRDPGALNNLGNVLSDMGRHEEAIQCFRRVLDIQSNHAPAHYNMGQSLAALDRLEEAVVSFQSALEHGAGADASRLADVYASLGEALVGLGRYDDALAACRAMHAFKPEVAEWNESLALLLLGRYAEGWLKYEGRWFVPDHDRPRADARLPDLAEVAGKSILLTCEQGHGDIFQFARYAPLLGRLGARVFLQVYVEQKELMQTLEDVEMVIAREEPEPPTDIVTPLLSMPLVFDTELDSVPADVPYLRAPAARLEVWQQRLGPRTRPRIGLAWWGSQHIAKRSLSIETLLPVLSLPSIEIHGLQTEFPSPQRDWLATHPLVIDHSDELRDYADTAALISLLDLVITIDTSVAHLAGALGKPVWIMLPYSADWRWLLDCDDSPWYPTARLFRQHRRGNWDGVVADVANELVAWLADS
ncbi:MAG TPA: tetratricopeptide repeat-containing glycosyltransferase family protein [Acetobacteraceae bacterium]|jgi:tetratricopeptide (TPR) repeat protein|nr:tetratricopeptide repeat-containing glycosyltransferase family protein [Acetobacteraceae bacterium]